MFDGRHISSGHSYSACSSVSLFIFTLPCFDLSMEKEYNNDDAQLAQMGHKSELKRSYSLM